MQNLVVLMIVLLLTACAAPKPAPDAFNDAEQAMDTAIRAGRFAREKLEEAHKGMEHKQYDKAIYLIEQSEINSELAIEKSKAAIMRAKVSELARENEILQEDFESTFGGEFE